MIVHAVFEQVDWLHRHGTEVPAGHQVLELSPRQRQILLFLLSGESLRRIAAIMGLSEHTIRAHVKDLYRQLGVNNRGVALGKVRNRWPTAHHQVGLGRSTALFYENGHPRWKTSRTGDIMCNNLPCHYLRTFRTGRL